MILVWLVSFFSLKFIYIIEFARKSFSKINEIEGDLPMKKRKPDDNYKNTTIQQ